MNWTLFIDALWTPALLTSVVFGLLLGAFYGFSVAGDGGRPVYPTQLWITRLAFFVTIGLLGLQGEVPFRLERQIAQSILWTLLCVAIGIGHWLRLWIERWRIRRRTQKLTE